MDNLNCWIFFQTKDDFIQCSIWSNLLPFFIIGKVCRKSPENIIVFPPKLIWFLQISCKLLSTASKIYFELILISSHSIRSISLKKLANLLFKLISHNVFSLTSKGILKAECTVLPFFNIVAAIPVPATVNTLKFFY